MGFGIRRPGLSPCGPSWVTLSTQVSVSETQFPCLQNSSAHDNVPERVVAKIKTLSEGPCGQESGHECPLGIQPASCTPGAAHGDRSSQETPRGPSAWGRILTVLLPAGARLA